VREKERENSSPLNPLLLIKGIDDIQEQLIDTQHKKGIRMDTEKRLAKRLDFLRKSTLNSFIPTPVM